MIFDIYSAIHLYNSKGTLQLFFKVFLSSVNTHAVIKKIF